MPKFIAQSETAECGLACVAMIAQQLGSSVQLVQLRELQPVSSRGMSFMDIQQVATRIGFAATGYKCDADALRQLKLPAVIHWKHNHFVVLHKLSRRRATIIDPAYGIREIELDQLASSYSGTAMAFERQPGVRPVFARPPGWRRLISQLSAPYGSLIGVLFIGVVLEGVALVAPLYMQVLTDRVLAWPAPALIAPVAAYFIFVYAVQAALNLIRHQAAERLIINMADSFADRVSRRVFDLPLAFFLARSTADVMSRFRSVGTVINVVIRVSVGAIIDAVVVSAAAVALFLYSTDLALLSIGLIALASIIRLSVSPREQRLNQEDVAASAVETGAMFQNLSAIEPIKAQNMGERMRKRWQESFRHSLLTGYRRARFEISINTVEGFVAAAENVIVLSVGASLVLRQEFSLGTLLAFFTYRLYLRERAISIIQGIAGVVAARVHVDRVFDLTGPTIQVPTEVRTATQALDGRLEFDNVSFSYPGALQAVIQHASFVVEPGECIGIVGESGAGKSTLLRLLLGLVPPTSGAIRVDGQPVLESDVGGFRDRVGVVLQDDRVFTGTLSQNISCFDPMMDVQRVMLAIEKASLVEVLKDLPMGINTILTEGGANLSSGQRQRIMLARVFYKAPAIIVLDEGTANLDGATERQILDALLALPATKIIVAHHASALKGADRVYTLSNGRLELREPV